MELAFKTIARIFQEQYSQQSQQFADGFRACYALFEAGYGKSTYKNLLEEYNNLQDTLLRSKDRVYFQQLLLEKKTDTLDQTRKECKEQSKLWKESEERFLGQIIQLQRDYKELLYKPETNIKPQPLLQLEKENRILKKLLYEKAYLNIPTVYNLDNDIRNNLYQLLLLLFKIEAENNAIKNSINSRIRRAIRILREDLYDGQTADELSNNLEDLKIRIQSFQEQLTDLANQSIQAIVKIEEGPAQQQT